jgi:integrase
VKPSPATKRTAFKAVALNTIFGSPVYTEGLRPAGGGGEASYWLPLLALYTGARLEELGQLRPRDIAQVPYTDGDGGNQIAWVIVITEDPADGLKLKNAWSARHVPVHPVLIDLGFIAYVEAMKDRKNAKGQPRIFPDLRPDKYGTETANFSKWFNRYLRDPLGIADRRLVFHSFRHSFAHYARENEIPKPVSGAITAHKSKDVGDSYGEVDFPMRPLVEGMRRYRVPGLILPPGSSHSPTA